jgi:hypothetical protein
VFFFSLSLSHSLTHTSTKHTAETKLNNVFVMLTLFSIFVKVEVSSPNAESENTLCTNSILGQTCTTATPASESNGSKVTERPASATTERPMSDINISTNDSGELAVVTNCNSYNTSYCFDESREQFL